MKTTITRLQCRGMLFCCLTLGSLLLINCSTKDMEYIDPYEFVNDEFEEIPDLPEVEDEDPEIVEPETGSVEGSEETESIITDVLNAGEDGEISEDTKEQLNEVESFTASMPATVTEKAQNLDEAAIDDILDEEQELPADLAEVRESLKNVSPEIKALLPKIQLTADLDGLGGSADAPLAFDPYEGDFYSQAVTSPCAEAAYDAFDAKILDLSTQRDANLFIIESNYARRMDEAETRYEDRLALQATRYAENKADLKNTLTDILEAAEQAESIGETELAAQLRQLTLLYAVDARAALEEWNTLVLQLLENLQEEEKAQAQTIRETKTAEVTAAFEAARAQAQTVLNTSLNNCHNQGSGN